jgi:hypothetical protein
LNGGQGYYALRELTGMPTHNFPLTRLKYSDDKLFGVISNWDKKRYVMGASCQHSIHNLVPNHAYSLIGAYEVKDNRGAVHKLFKMRNPWGKERYNGPFSDDDTKFWGTVSSAE